MTCCEPILVPFTAEAQTTINYTPAMREKYGRVPTVIVLYQDENGEYYISNSFNPVNLSGSPVNLITVDHGGGPSTGVIKIAQ